MNVSPQRRTFSLQGLALMLLGLALVAVELRHAILLNEHGRGVRLLLFLVATSLSVWGLKEVIAAWWPGLRGWRGAGGSVRRRVMFPVEGWIYVAIMGVVFAGSLVGRSNTLLMVFAVMAGPWVLNGGMVFSMLRRLNVRRTIPERVMAGEPFSVQVTLANPKRWLAAWLMAVRDRVDNGQEVLHPEVVFLRVGRRSEQTGRYRLRLLQRGRYSFGPLQVNSRFPLGLVERGLVISQEAEILVYPRIGRLSAGWRREMRSATELVSQRQPRTGAFDDDFHRIREYRPGDDPRAIHWRTSARMNDLMVREFRESRDRHLVVLVDVWQPLRPTLADRERFECAMSLAATICLEQLRNSRGANLFFAANGEPQQQWGGRAGVASLESLLDLMALTQPTPGAALEPLLHFAREEQTPHTRMLLITSHASRAGDFSRAAAGGDEDGGRIALEPPQVLVADPRELTQVMTFE